MNGLSMSRAWSIAVLLLILAAVACAQKTTPSAMDSTPAPATTTDSQPIPPSERVPRITADELLQKINSHADILIVDSRIDVEKLFDSGHIPGAIPMPLSTVMEGQWSPPIDQEIVFYCT
jgi:3-mercaptopyruvate sulfurtransferase SseA